MYDYFLCAESLSLPLVTMIQYLILPDTEFACNFLLIYFFISALLVDKLHNVLLEDEAVLFYS